MNINEAYSILEVNSESSEEEINKSFRKKAAKAHPDQNKNSNAEEEFKKINTAFQTIKDYKNNPQPNNQFHYQQVSLEDFFSQVNFGFQHHFQQQRIYQTVTVDVFEATKGISKKVNYTHKVKCGKCNNGQKKAECDNCNKTGVVDKTNDITIKIPSGVNDKQRIIVQNVGDYNANTNSINPAIFLINVKKHENIQRINNHLVSMLDISLLDALKGTSTEVDTIKGKLKLKIPPGIKNRNEVIAKGLGVFPFGNHIFIINVNYPEDTNKLIEFLQKGEDHGV